MANVIMSDGKCYCFDAKVCLMLLSFCSSSVGTASVPGSALPAGQTRVAHK